MSFHAVSKATAVTAGSAADADVVLRAANSLRAGQVVAIPTDTVYGLAAAIDRPDAIDRLYAIKGRQAEKAIPVLIADFEDVHRLTPNFSPRAVQLARSFWPGALTLVLAARPDLPEGVTTVNGDGMQTVAVRVPDNALARGIIGAAGGALAVTSANRSGAVPAVEAGEVHQLRLAQPLLIVDGGRAPGGVPSTIVAVTAEAVEVLREGAIPTPAIAAALAQIDPVGSAEVRARYDQRMMEDHERSDARKTNS